MGVAILSGEARARGLRICYAFATLMATRLGRPSGDVVVNCYTSKHEVAGEALPQHLEKEIRMERFIAPRRQAGRLALAIGLGALLTSGATGWAAAAPGADETFGIRAPQSIPKAVKAVRPTPSEKMGVSLGILPEVRLRALDKDLLLKE